MFVDCLIFYFWFCMGWYGGYCYLVGIVMFVKDYVWLLFFCCFGDDVVISDGVYYFYCFVG